MDPITIATAVISALQPYLSKAGEEVAGELGKQALAKAQGLLTTIRARWSGQPAISEAVDQLTADPAGNRDRFAMTLAVQLAQDPELTQALSRILQNEPPEVVAQQFAKNVTTATAVKVDLMTKGSVDAKQIAEEVGSATAVSIGTLG